MVNSSIRFATNPLKSPGEAKEINRRKQLTQQRLSNGSSAPGLVRKQASKNNRSIRTPRKTGSCSLLLACVELVHSPPNHKGHRHGRALHQRRVRLPRLDRALVRRRVSGSSDSLGNHARSARLRACHAHRAASGGADGGPEPRALGVTHRCHIHEWDDSWLEGSDYEIPEDTDFWMNGVRFQR